MKNTTYKLGLAAVAALAVTLGACSDKGAATTEGPLPSTERNANQRPARDRDQDQTRDQLGQTGY